MKKIIFIINPVSGVGKKNSLPKLIQKNLNHKLFEYKIVYSKYRGHSFEIAKDAAQNKIDILCIAGGDGSVNEVGSALVNTTTSLAILPVGSGNGVARHLGIPMKLKNAILRINSANSVQMDTLKINDRVAIGVSGFGFDALIAHKFDTFNTRGFLGYVKLTIKEWRKYHGIQLKTNNKEYNDILLCSIANTNQFGNNVYVSPYSDVTDGKFEVALVKMTSTIGLFKDRKSVV